MSIKIERIANELIKEISYILMLEVKDPDLKFVTITACHLSSDLGHAKVYFTVLDKDINTTTKSLNDAKGFIRRELTKRVDIRHMPELEFTYDESIDYGKRIENIIDHMHEN